MIGSRVLEAWDVAKNDGKRDYEEERNEPGFQPLHQARGPIEDPLLEVVRAHRSAHWRPSWASEQKTAEGPSLFRRARWDAYHCRRDRPHGKGGEKIGEMDSPGWQYGINVPG
jgi:hypothetical protein